MAVANRFSMWAPTTITTTAIDGGQVPAFVDLGARLLRLHQGYAAGLQENGGGCNAMRSFMLATRIGDISGPKHGQCLQCHRNIVHSMGIRHTHKVQDVANIPEAGTAPAIEGMIKAIRDAAIMGMVKATRDAAIMGMTNLGRIIDLGCGVLRSRELGDHSLL